MPTSKVELGSILKDDIGATYDNAENTSCSGREAIASTSVLSGEDLGRDSVQNSVHYLHDVGLTIMSYLHTTRITHVTMECIPTGKAFKFEY